MKPIFKKYPKIRQFKDVVRNIKFKANYKLQDENGDPIYEESKKPEIVFTGTIKLHGTNAGICFTPEEGLIAQKRNGFIEPNNLTAHFGFNQFVQVEKKNELHQLMSDLWFTYCKIGQQITLYGEWAGQGIQKGVGISELKKAFYIFDLRVYDPISDKSEWIDVSKLNIEIDRVFNIYSFDVYKLNINFNNPELSQNTLIEFTNKVEQECPVSKSFGVSGVGEGIVWKAVWKDERYVFKVKGDKHSTSRVKKLASVNTEVIKNINEFVEYACTINRIEQCIQETNAIKKEHISDLLRWVANDIIAEESDVLSANNLEWKQVAKEVNNKVRQIYFSKIDRL